MSLTELMSLPYPELQGWLQYFERFPSGWREDYRTYLIVSAFAGSDKVKPEDLFTSLKTMRDHEKAKEEELVQQKGILAFIERFAPKIKGDISFLSPKG
jgi:hypothetical protein